MYGKRIKIFIIFVMLLVLVCLLRLTQMQLLSTSSYRERIAELKRQRGASRLLKTIRGRILDRNGKVLATDEARFELCIDYRFSSLLDGRVRRKEKPDKLQIKLDNLTKMIEKCARFKGVETSEIKSEIKEINDFIWNRRAFQAWRTRFASPELINKHGSIVSVPLSKALADFQERIPSPKRRLELVNKVDIAEMHDSWPLLELETDDDIFTAQLEFMDITGVAILPGARRIYPYGSVAAQTIGWVGSATQEQDRELFENDRLSRYLTGDVCGREDGVEYVCEAILRGRRGEDIYDIDRTLVSRTPTQFGRNVTLTLDIELQQRIEQHILNCDLNANCQAPTAAVVIDVASGDILALVSTPVFDLNRARYDYADLLRDANEPLRNRAINKQYPPGSVVKPLILIAGMESGKITADEIISCPAKAAPKYWPSCWVFNRFRSGHDLKWSNNARNAVRGSCNIYFSRLADRIEPPVLQRWLYNFGYGHEIALAPPGVRRPPPNRDLRQAQGQISTAPVPPRVKVSSFEQIPPLKKAERRHFGIGQANLRVTPLQVANALAAIARGEVYKLPRLFANDPNNPQPDSAGQDGVLSEGPQPETLLNISPQTLAVVLDGMGAVVNEPGGTAYSVFSQSGLTRQGVKVYGKTGSTQQPDNAWFGGFATDADGRSISVAVVVEGGEHGSSDAGPLAREIIQFCIEGGYLGQAQVTTD
ncbi:MAG: peptidoglycan D,D-transpeptidase FtsI family protein [Planctomycetota bacterium]|jgi:penicillin-binding protein 2